MIRHRRRGTPGPSHYPSNGVKVENSWVALDDPEAEYRQARTELSLLQIKADGSKVLIAPLHADGMLA